MTRFRGSRVMTDEWRHFDFAVSDGVAQITLNRPEKLNPLTFESYADLRDLFGELPLRTGVRSVIITGEGKGSDSAQAATSKRSSVSCRRWGRLSLLGVHTHDGSGHQGDPRLFRCRWWRQSTAWRPAPAPSSRWPATSGSFRSARSFAFLFTRVGLSGRRHGRRLPAATRDRRPGSRHRTADVRRHDHCRRRRSRSGWRTR